MTLSGTIVAISLLSQLLSNPVGFTAKSDGAFASLFVAGMSVPSNKASATTGATHNPCGRRASTRSRQPHHRHGSEAFRPPSTIPRDPLFRRETMRLFDGNSSPDENEKSASSSSSTIPRRIPVLPNGTAQFQTEPVSVNSGEEMIIQDGEAFLMNPMDDFSAEETVISLEGTRTNDDYRTGLVTIGFITFLFSTNSPVLHGAFTAGDHPPPVLLVNAAVSVVALVGLLLGGDTLEENSSSPGASGNVDAPNNKSSKRNNNNTSFLGGLELGMWKFLGTTSNLYGLALTTAGHGALLIQLTTLIVPITRAVFYKESISTKLKLSIALALSGVVCFANDPTGTPSMLGDGLCVFAAVCYSAYDLRLYEYGKVVEAVKPLITTKIATQAMLSVALLFLAPSSSLFSGEIDVSSSPSSPSWQESREYLSQTLLASSDNGSSLPWLPVAAAIVWSGVAVNAIAPFLQVSGQQIVGPTKCQTIYASQPLWAAILSFVFLGERLGVSGLVGGAAFLVALALAATAEITQPATSGAEAENAPTTTTITTMQ